MSSEASASSCRIRILTGIIEESSVAVNFVRVKTTCPLPLQPQVDLPVLCLSLCDPVDCKPSRAPLSKEFPSHGYWSGLPFPSPGDLPDPGIEPVSLSTPALAGKFFTTEPPRKPNPALLGVGPSLIVVEWVNKQAQKPGRKWIDEAGTSSW